MKISQAHLARLKGRAPPKTVDKPAAVPAHDSDALAKALLRQLREKPAAVAYSFRTERDADGRLRSILATPEGEGEALRFDVARSEDGELRRIAVTPEGDKDA